MSNFCKLSVPDIYVLYEKLCLKAALISKLAACLVTTDVARPQRKARRGRTARHNSLKTPEFPGTLAAFQCVRFHMEQIRSMDMLLNPGALAAGDDFKVKSSFAPELYAMVYAVKLFQLNVHCTACWEHGTC